MRTIVELLSYLRAKNISLSLAGDVLKCSTPPGALTAELHQELADRKPEIIVFLRSSRGDRHNTKPNIVRIDRSRPLPLSLAQERLLFLNQLDPNSAVNNIGLAIRMVGPLNIPALERALKAIVHRHEELRTSFMQVNGEPRAMICDGRNWAIQTVDVQHLAGSGAESELLKCASHLTGEIFDIARGPLFRVHRLIAGPDDQIMVLTVHHIVSDGWSMGILLREFGELYVADVAGRKPALPLLNIQYVDFAAWQREWLESGELERQLPYWKKQLDGAPPVVGFPADHRRRPTEMYRGRRSKLVLPREFADSLKHLSRRHGVTLFMTLLAGFKVLLARYSGQDDIVLGSASANRTGHELYQLIGFFVNNLVLRADLSGNPSFAEFLVRVREVALRAYEHQDVPFDKLVQALRPERSLEHSPLFQVMFTMQSFPLDDLLLPGIVSTPVELEIETARFDLTVEVFPRHGELWAFFDYNSDLYEPETIAQIQQHYLAILTAVCVDPRQRVGEIALLSPLERKQLLSDWNQTAAEMPEICFHERFQAHARRTPDRIAVMAGGESISYRELEQRAIRIAAALRACGAGPEKLVALCLGRSTDLVAAMLGVAKSGAAYIPLDPAYPKGRIANILEDAKPSVVLSSREFLPLLVGEDLNVLCLDEIDGGEESSGTHSATENGRSASGVTPENLAYVIFTSGSTGRPKGVQITHRALINFLESMSNAPGFSPDDVLLAVTTVSFDIAALELLLPLYTGATVCIALQPGDPESLMADLSRFRPTVMQATPSTWKLLIAAGWKGDSQLKILCGGEALDTDLARSLLVRSNSLWNMYGPTETTVWSAVLRIEEVGTSAIPVGRPIQNTSFYVLDTFQQPVPRGVAGELWIGGEGLARGYLHRPDLTDERFMVLPLSDGLPTRVYRTGDLVRYRPDRTLEFLGRMDRQVKLRGFRIELGEIENALRNCSGIGDAITVLIEEDGDQLLVAYLVAAENDAPSAANVRDHLRTTLPEYMVPATFVFLKEFPRLPNGKLDRAKLPPPRSFANESVEDYIAPATTLQQTIAAVFRQILNIDRVGVDENFFDLGAHSLQIVKIQGELNQVLDAKTPLMSFFQYPTIRTLAKSIEEHDEKEALTLQQQTIEDQVRAI